MKYAAQLDGIRGIAILAVLLEHFAGYIGRPISAGYYGVNLFFVLSGFLITTTLIEKTNQTFRKSLFNFLARRSLRIFPIYYIIVVLLFVFQAPAINERLPYLLSYTYNYQLAYLDFPEDPYRAVWSLSVEEQFYIIFPFIAITLRNRSKALIVVCLFFIVLSACQLFANVFELQQYNYVSLLTNMAPLCFGAIGAILNRNKAVIYGSKLIEFGLLILLVLVNTFLALNYQIIIWGVINLYLILKASENSFSIENLRLMLLNKRLISIGKISYGIYLYHGVIAFYVAKYIFDPIWLNIDFESWGTFAKLEFHSWIIKLPFYSLLSISIAFYSYKYLEAPILKLKRYFI